MSRSILFILTLCWMISPLSKAQTASDIALIEKVVYAYFEGHGTADRGLLSQAFAADAASMVGGVKNDSGVTEIRVWKDMNKVIDRWVGNTNPGGAHRDGEILDISVVDGRLATVIFRFTDEFYDAFTLLKQDDGSWKIANKTFIAQ